MCFLIFPTFKAWGGYSKAVAEQRVGNFKAQVFANTAWAFATAAQSESQLFTALARVAERYMGDFSEQNLANTKWAFTNAGLLSQDKVVDEALLAQMTRTSFRLGHDRDRKVGNGQVGTKPSASL